MLSLFFKTHNDVTASLFNVLCAAIDAHKSQTRKNLARTPYISHPIEVAHFVVRALEACGNCKPETVAAALMHDMVEDTEWTHEMVNDTFGPVVAAYVKELTNDPALDRLAQKRAQIAKMPKMSHGAQVIKMADKLSNCLDWPPSWSVERCQGYVLLSKRIFDLAPDTPAKEFLYFEFKIRVLSSAIKRNGEFHELFPADRSDEYNAAFLEDFLSGKFDNNNNASVPL